MIPLRVWESRLVRTPSLTLGYTALKAIPGGKIKQKKKGGLFFKAYSSICPHQNKTTGPLKWRIESSQPSLLKVGEDRKEGRSEGGSLEHDTPISPCRFNQVQGATTRHSPKPCSPELQESWYSLESALGDF